MIRCSVNNQVFENNQQSPEAVGVQVIDTTQTHQFTLDLPERQQRIQQQHQLDDRQIHEKMQQSIREFNHLLTTQLEIQRAYFEQKIQADRDALAEDAELDKLEIANRDLNDLLQADQSKIAKLKRSVADKQEKCQQQDQRMQKLASDIETKSEMRANLQADLQALESQNTDLVKEKELKQL